MPAIELRVSEPYERDIGKCRVRIPKKYLQTLGIKSGDAVTITGKRKAAAFAYPILEESKEDIIMMDSTLRSNAGAALNERVKIEKAEYAEAKKVFFEVSNKEFKLQNKALKTIFKKKLNNFLVVEGNSFNVNVLGSNITFTISRTDPKGVVLITQKTVVSIEKSKKTVETKVTYEDIGGLKMQLQTLREMVELPLKYPSLFKKVGIEPPRGVLLYGPPGCGKTLMAKALANETNAKFFSINGPEIMSKYYGETEAKLREIFKVAKKNAPAIIFIDELDSIAPKRSEAFGEAEVRVVAQLLTLMDGLKDRGDVIVIGATNRIEDVDPALRRPGRFDREIEIGVPNEDGRLEILKIHVRGMPLAEDVDLKKYARMTAGYTGADLAALCREAAFNAIRRVAPRVLEGEALTEEKLNEIKVNDADFMQAYRQIVPTALRELYFEVPKVTWNDIGGYQDVLKKLRLNFVEAIKNIEKFKSVGIEPPRGVLLYGPPGCGKTLMAKALANESKANLITIKGPEILSKWVGESEKAIREIFRKAKSSAPSIILFDEIDSITKIRGGEYEAIESLVSQLITSIDSLQPEDMVFLIGTTNRPDLIDPSLLRPGRFDLLIYVRPPNMQEREEILKILLKNTKLDPSVDISKIAALTEGYSGADIKSVVREAGISAISRGSTIINSEDFEKALANVKPSLTPQLIKFYEEMEKRLESRFNLRIGSPYT
ncbi:MAG: CDC48 family AAA ATPase [Nitrososphaeria archaeon]